MYGECGVCSDGDGRADGVVDDLCECGGWAGDRCVEWDGDGCGEHCVDAGVVDVCGYGGEPDYSCAEHYDFEYRWECGHAADAGVDGGLCDLGEYVWGDAWIADGMHGFDYVYADGEWDADGDVCDCG